MLLSEHVHCVAIAFKMTKRVKQWICIRFYMKLECSFMQTIGWFRRPQLWASGDWQLYHNNMPAHASCLVQRFFCKISNHPGDSAPLFSRDLVPCDFWLFPKLKSPLKGKRFQTINKIQENMTGQLMVIERTVWGPKVPTLRGIEVSLSYVQYVLYLVSFSVNVCIFHITWLHIFRTDLTYTESYHDPLLSPLVATSLG